MKETILLTLIAVGGTLVGSFGGHILQSKLKERSERQTKRHETRMALYLEAMDFAERTEAWLDHLQTPDALRQGFLAVTGEENITAKMRLFAPEAVMAEWRNLVTVSAALSWHLRESGYEPASGGMGIPDIAELVAVKDAISLLRTSMRQAIDVPDN